MAGGIGNSNAKFQTALPLVHHFLKEWKTLGKVPEKTKSNFPSIYMVVTFLENSRNTLCLFVSQEQVLGTDNYKLVFHLHECPVEHFKITASSSSFCTCCRMSGCLASLTHIPLCQLGTQLSWQSKLSAYFPNVPWLFPEGEYNLCREPARYKKIKDVMYGSLLVLAQPHSHSLPEQLLPGSRDLETGWYGTTQQASQASDVHLLNWYCSKPQSRHRP